MLELVSAKEMRLIEQYYIDEIGIPAQLLMERAACFAANRIKAYLWERKISKPRVLIACGMGNNGADGLALARILSEMDAVVSVIHVGQKEKQSELNHWQENICKALSIPIYSFVEYETKHLQDMDFDVVVEAVLGIGVNRALSGDFEKMIMYLNHYEKAYKVALDIPTGIHTDNGLLLGSCFMADETVTFGAQKQGLYLMDGKNASGMISSDRCAMPYRTEFFPEHKLLLNPEDRSFRNALKRNPNGNKASFGKLAMIVGSKDIPGAACLAVGGAFRSGAGYIKVCTHTENKSFILEKYPESVLSLYQDEMPALDELLWFADVLAIGCGTGVNFAEKCLEQIITLKEREISQNQNAIRTFALILDADAITAVVQKLLLLERLTTLGFQVVLTPHMMEFSRLTGWPIEEIKKNRMQMAMQFSKEQKVCLALKDAQTIIAYQNEISLNCYGNDGMAVAGSGDALCGIISAIVANQHDVGAAKYGVLLHALAGDMAKKELGVHSMLVQDLIAKIPDVIKEYIDME